MNSYPNILLSISSSLPLSLSFPRYFLSPPFLPPPYLSISSSLPLPPLLSILLSSSLLSSFLSLLYPAFFFLHLYPFILPSSSSLYFSLLFLLFFLPLPVSLPASTFPSPLYPTLLHTFPCFPYPPFLSPSLPLFPCWKQYKMTASDSFGSTCLAGYIIIPRVVAL